MRRVELFNKGWEFVLPEQDPEKVDLPHTWNGIDGQDGGSDYLRTAATYTKRFQKPEIGVGETPILQFRGVNSECEVSLNGDVLCRHEGGYSTFNVDLSPAMKPGANCLEVKVSNEKNESVYPQRADFTFYGGIYRDVYLIIQPKDCLDFGPDAGPPLKLTTKIEGDRGFLFSEVYVKGRGEARVTVYEGGREVGRGVAGGEAIEIPGVRLWNGKADPFLYTVKAELRLGTELYDEVTERCGFRTFHVDPKKGFFLNGKSYPLRGVCRHQDRPDVGNAITKADQDEDMAMILEVGANTVRLAHYQHDQYFYDLCDQKGLIVWAEIPYISEYMAAADGNALSQIQELVRQNYNHPSIICWGISNEIMIKRRYSTRLIVENHRKCHEFCKAEDPQRYTAIACYSVTRSGHPTARITDLVSWNLYFGWYVPLSPKWTFRKLGWFKKFHRKTPIGLSEYGAEGMPNLHAAKPKRFDNTEEYQCIFHEKYMELIKTRPWIWATHVWNMFDFGSDGRNQGGEPGRNHKGLVTFDRKIKKDAFYLYKAYWSKEPFVYITGKRYKNRESEALKIKVYSNCKVLTLHHNGKLVETKKAENKERVFEFTTLMAARNEITVRSGEAYDAAVFYKVDKPDPNYSLPRSNKGNNMSWEK